MFPPRIGRELRVHRLGSHHADHGQHPIVVFKRKNSLWPAGPHRAARSQLPRGGEQGYRESGDQQGSRPRSRWWFTRGPNGVRAPDLSTKPDMLVGSGAGNRAPMITRYGRASDPVPGRDMGAGAGRTPGKAVIVSTVLAGRAAEVRTLRCANHETPSADGTPGSETPSRIR